MGLLLTISSTSVFPGSNSSIDLGVTSLRWKNGWFSQTVTVGTLAAGGAVLGSSGSISGTLTVGTLSSGGAVIGSSGSISGTLTVGTLSSGGAVIGASGSISGSLIIGGNSTFGQFLISDSKNIIVGTGTGTTFATGTNQKIGFYGTTAIVQVTALTAQVGTLTFSDPTSADYAIADLTSTGPFGFASADEGQSVLKIIGNLQTRLSELETKLQSYGLLP